MRAAGRQLDCRRSRRRLVRSQRLYGAHAMKAAILRERSGALLLVSPVLVFMAVFFLWPLWAMVTAAFVDDAVSKVLPRTAASIVSWDGQGVPSEAAHKALVQDLKAATDEQALGEAVRRLNSAAS